LDIERKEVRKYFKILSYSLLMWLIAGSVAFSSGFKEALQEDARILLKCCGEAFILLIFITFLILSEYSELCEFLAVRIACFLCCVFQPKPGVRSSHNRKKSISDSNQALMANSVSIQTIHQGAGPFELLDKGI